MEAFLARLGNLCWWTACAVNLALDALAGYITWVCWWNGVTIGQILIGWLALWLLVQLPISLVGGGLKYLFKGTLA